MTDRNWPPEGECEDEGCPHYGTPHGHAEAGNAPDPDPLAPREQEDEPPP